MSTIAEAAATVQFDTEAFDAVSDRAYAALGACDGRFAKAVALARSGAVRLLPDGQARVQSQEEDGQGYTVNGACPCPDAQHRADNGHCKHVIATWIMRRVDAPRPQALCPTATPDAESGVGAYPPPALPEAPASVNVRLTLHGREIQVTLRDTDETVLLTRLEALLARYPLPEKAEASSAPESQPEGWCAIHSLQMKQTTKDGRAWYSHKLADGSWCKGKKGQGR